MTLKKYINCKNQLRKENNKFIYLKNMNEKKNSDILALENNKHYPESRNLESSAQRGKQLLLLI